MQPDPCVRKFHNQIKHMKKRGPLSPKGRPHLLIIEKCACLRGFSYGSRSQNDGTEREDDGKVWGNRGNKITVRSGAPLPTGRTVRHW